MFQILFIWENAFTPSYYCPFELNIPFVSRKNNGLFVSSFPGRCEENGAEEKSQMEAGEKRVLEDRVLIRMKEGKMDGGWQRRWLL